MLTSIHLLWIGFFLRSQIKYGSVDNYLTILSQQRKSHIWSHNTDLRDAKVVFPSSAVWSLSSTSKFVTKRQETKKEKKRKKKRIWQICNKADVICFLWAWGIKWSDYVRDVVHRSVTLTSYLAPISLMRPAGLRGHPSVSERTTEGTARHGTGNRKI